MFDIVSFCTVSLQLVEISVDGVFDDDSFVGRSCKVKDLKRGV